MQSPQTSQIVSEIFIIGCSPIHSLECKGQKIPLKKAPLHLFKVKTTRASNMSHHWSYLKTEYEQSKGMQRSCWVPILQYNRHFAPQNQALFTGKHVSLALCFAAHLLLLPQSTCICARYNTCKGSVDPNRMGRSMVCSWEGGEK